MSQEIKPIAMYLPQFHRTPENDAWWGDGFTEWTAVKKAEALFEDHVQPKVPYNNYYYDLTKKESFLYQADLMKQYGVYGMCFYHYYFENGKKVLHKPAEKLLQWKDIDMPFCFCWANESWGRTWSKLQGKNVWSDKFEKLNFPNDDGVLLNQKYGLKEEWKKHFEYLLPFFKDKRYIRKDGKLLLLLYRPSGIYCLQPMLDYWRELAKEYGIEDFFFIGLNSVQKKEGLDALLFNAPVMFDRSIRHRKNGISMYSYDVIWENILKAEPAANVKTYFGGFVNYDDTPRRGKNGLVADGFTADKFKNYLEQLAQKNCEQGNDYLFINAWNEWGEGMCLEPDEADGFSCLEAVRNVVNSVKVKRHRPKEIQSENIEIQYYQNEVGRQRTLVNCYDRWMTLKEKNISPIDYVIKKEWKKIALYGMGNLGLHFLHELLRYEQQISYIVDQRSNMHYPGIDIIPPENEFPLADVMIVTAVADFDEIYRLCKTKFKGDIISLEQIIYECE